MQVPIIYYQAAVTNNTNCFVSDIVTALVQAISGSTATSTHVKGGASGINTNLAANVPSGSIADPNRASPGTVPRAYLNIMFFDSLSRTKSRETV